MNNNFVKSLENLINTHGIDSKLNIPDFLLADHLNKYLNCLRYLQVQNSAWHGIDTYLFDENLNTEQIVEPTELW